MLIRDGKAALATDHEGVASARKRANKSQRMQGANQVGTADRSEQRHYTVSATRGAFRSMPARTGSLWPSRKPKTTQPSRAWRSASRQSSRVGPLAQTPG